MIDIRPSNYALRKYSSGSYEEKTNYDGVMNISHLTDKLCYIYHAHGDFTKEDYKEIGEILSELGYVDVLLERHGKLKTIKIESFIRMAK